MNYRTIGKRITALVMTLAVTISTFSATLEARAMTDLDQSEYEEIVSTYSVDDSVLGFRDYVEQFGEVYPRMSYELEASDYVRYEEDDITAVPESLENYEGMEGTSIVTSENGYIEYEVEIGESGFYDISLLYYPIEGNSAAIQRSFFVDGELPYRELSLIEFSRVWKNSITETYLDEEGITLKNWEQDNQGNDLKPTALEAPEWLTSYLFDSDGYITTQLSVYLEKGSHTISMLSLREPMLLRKIYLSNAKETLTYAQIKEQQDAKGATPTTGQMIRIEAENVSTTSSQMLYPRQDQSSPSVYPSSTKELKNNSLGGTS
ncbi:MAG: ABC transporter substrate-binding protein, partial [Clostridiales bacterium]|nr:ABC transporter substrate-binding protein [Clostridiales bacterium]